MAGRRSVAGRRRRRAIVRLDLAGSVAIVGTFDDVELLLPAADVFVSPAPEGGIQPVLEAMAAGLPFVAADVPDNRWLQGDPAAGVHFPPDDAEALAAAILGLLDDADAAQQLGPAGWQRARGFHPAGQWPRGFARCWRTQLWTTET